MKNSLLGVSSSGLWQPPLYLFPVAEVLLCDIGHVQVWFLQTLTVPFGAAREGTYVCPLPQLLSLMCKQRFVAAVLWLKQAD